MNESDVAFEQESYDRCEESIAALWLVTLGAKVIITLGVVCLIAALIGALVCLSPG